MSKKMSRYPTDRKVYVGDLGNSARKNELEYAFGAYGPLRSVWIARSPPGFAFVEFEDARDAADAVRGLDGRTICGRRARVELSTGKSTKPGRSGGSGGGDRRGVGVPDRYGGGGGGGRGMGGGGRNAGGVVGGAVGAESKCYDCGDRGHYARDCHRHGRSRRRHSPSRSRSVSRGRRSHSRSASRSRSRSVSGTRETSRRAREAYGRSRENGRENGESAYRYSEEERNGGGAIADSPSP
ncbi:probable splicing factor, arginine/serine-rich 6 isoform X3 [Musca domestica]|uniref:Probable splicing factor, arginine/serine-rich 6 isoform X3 n=1 Tax=Musca domestica TaxID=7370 RepID=A0ABM3VEY8_MUSDO|nr:probable splicing factor, arginine/serine-rich 6 isoform X3 [Musca domestica]